MSEKYRFDTMSLHSGHVPEKKLVKSCSNLSNNVLCFKDTDEAAALYNMEVGGHLYTRISNPTIATLEQRLASLDGGVVVLLAQVEWLQCI